jgi:hypothetical protein
MAIRANPAMGGARQQVYQRSDDAAENIDPSSPKQALADLRAAGAARRKAAAP